METSIDDIELAIEDEILQIAAILCQYRLQFTVFGDLPDLRENRAEN